MHFYKNGNYVVCIMDDGTKIRKTDEKAFIPSFAECTDVKITNKCCQFCNFCYEGCTSNGKHGDLLKYKFLDTLHPYTEMALNGNDMDHPQLIEFLKLLKSKKVFANITVHQNQFMQNLELIGDLTDLKLINGLGVSYSKYDENFINELKKFPNSVIHTINGIIKVSDLEKIKGNNFKILILGYKNIRRGSEYLTHYNKTIASNQEYLYNALPNIIKEEWFNVVSFDNLAISQLDVKRLMPEDKWGEFYMGDDGNYTFYINLVDGTFAKNSLCETTYPIEDKTMDEMFNIIRNNK